MALPQNDLVVRINRKKPDAYVMRACEVAKTLQGKLKFVSDETAIPQLLNDGYPLEWARDYIITGCNSPSVAGRSLDIPGGMFNIASDAGSGPERRALATERRADRAARPGTPASSPAYEEVLDAYKQQVEAFSRSASSSRTWTGCFTGSLLPLLSSRASSTAPSRRGSTSGMGARALLSRGRFAVGGTERGRLSGRGQEGRLRGQETQHGSADHRSGHGTSKAKKRCSIS